MNFAAAVHQPEADFFDERGLPKEYKPPPMQPQIGSMNILRKVPNQANASTLVSDPVPDPVPTQDFPFLEFPLMEVVNQSQIDSSSISDTLDPRESSNSTKKATPSTHFPLKSVQNSSSDEEMAVFRDLTISARHTQSTRDSSTISISDNSATRKSTTGAKDGNPTALQVETSISFDTEGEMHPETQLSNNRSVMPTDVQALTVLQDLLSDDFQVKNRHSIQRKGEDEKEETFQLIQKIHNHSSKSNGIFKGSIHYISISTNSTDSRQLFQSISNSTNKN